MRIRDARVEALRLAAIAGIAVFHTFQPWFAVAVSGAWVPGAAALWALGAISLLGAFGNHVFFAISAYFLIPSVVRASQKQGYWGIQARKTVRRLVTVAVSVALWAAIALGVNAWVAPVPGVGLTSVSWLTVGLEFIWVYAALIAVTPLIGWLWSRMRRPHLLALSVIVAILAVSAYIAFVSPGDSERGLFEWRKLMSAASYLASFLMGGIIGTAGERSRGLHGKWWPFAAVLAASLAVEGAAAVTGNLSLLSALSFKSTSLLSFLLATAALLAVADDAPAAAADGVRARIAAAVRWLASAILGYYIFQSMFSGLWRPVFDGCCAQAIATAGVPGLLLAGLALSLAMLIVVLIADRVTRLPLLRALRLR